ncbi:ADP-ribose pyrophosphatase YjhB, NUDIX family [Micromonospora nigra]|uniref:ADP-ribose pyrophosphatase YjhB, NUDIX family n=1 Tax=Micromonospora nigra TaxID=145857 RepID=A0A1C6T296_9ACTN|nr:NUDIX hydrolase [Micromonospora nigra]SCL35692.1 ADP-ribose pyrophosphatase YjhB, NUDIX family [Micromonospora nigra]
MTWTEPAIWYANLPAFYAAAAAFITDPTGNVLLVKPTYRNHWSFPGGYVDEGEFPHAACVREVQEELGIGVVVKDLLVVDWALPAEERPRALVHFTFDCGTVTNLESSTLCRQEIQDLAFFPPRLAEQRLPGNVAPRVSAAIQARARTTSVYLAGGSAIQ